MTIFKLQRLIIHLFIKINIQNFYFYLIFTGCLYLKLGMYEDAKNEFNKLLERNPENIDYYYKLHDAENLRTDQEKYEMICKYRTKFPRALMPRRMILNYVSGKENILFLFSFRSLV